MKFIITLAAAALTLASIATAETLTLAGETAKITGPTGNRKNLTWDQGRFRFWSSQDSAPVWTFSAKEPGTVNIALNQSCFEIAGSTYTVTLGETTRELTVQDTKSWTNYQTVDAGKFTFKKGVNHLTIKPKKIKDRALMDLQKVTLTGDTGKLQQVKPRTHKRTGVLSKLNAPHPALTIADITPEGLNIKASGIDFLSDGTMVLTAWDQWGSVYLVKNYSGPREKIQIKRFARGLVEPLGVVVVDDIIYVQQKQELTRVLDTDKDGTADTFEVVCNAWDVSSNFHEFAFSPIYKDGHFYVTLAIAVNPGGATTNPQQKDRGTLIKIDPKTGKYEVLAAGFRTPNGLTHSPDGKSFLIADNQGDYLPANKIMNVKPGRFYNHRYNPPHPMSKLPVSPPLVWLPQNEIANSPTQPLVLKDGRYKGQIIVGDIHHGGLRRISTEEIDGELQGTAFRFAQTLRGGVNRLAHGPDGNIYLGNAGYNGNWGNGKRTGLLRLTLTDKPVFEILRVDTLTNGIRLTFTQPIKQNLGWDPNYYKIDTYTYKPTVRYGGPKINRYELPVKSATLSQDRTQVFLEIPNIQPGYVVHGTLDPEITHDGKTPSWTGEWWTTVNKIPSNKMGNTLPIPATAERIITIEEEIDSPHKNAITIFAENCASCHKTTDEKLVGPGLANLLGKKQTIIQKDGTEKQITVDEAYIRNSILNPATEWPKGYQPIMPPIAQNLKKQDIQDLITWLKTLK